MGEQAMGAGGAAVRKKARRGRKKKVLRKIVLWLLLILLLAGAAFLGYMHLKREYTVTYDSYTAAVGTISNALSFSGTLQPVDNETYTAPSAGTVRNVYVQKGQEVKEGDALIRMSNGKTIEAGCDGTVNQLPVKEGDEVAAGDTLAQVVDFAHMKVSIRVDEYDISSVHEGDPCHVTATATEDAFDSVIDDINYVSASTGSVAYYTATAYVDVPGGVYPGMQVTVTIPQEEAANVVILKEDAVSFDVTNRAFVYMMNDQEQLETVYVETGVSNGNYVEIKSGLQNGDTVYVEAASTEETSLLATLFGGQQFNMNRENRNRQFTNTNNGNMPSFGGGDMPGFNGGGGRP